MKLPPRAYCVCYLALILSSCGTVPEVDTRLRNLDLGSDAYVTRAGDTLETVAYRYKLTPNLLASLNPDVGRVFAPGTRLYVRSGAPAPSGYEAQATAQRDNRQVATERVDEQPVQTAAIRTPKAVKSRKYNPDIETSVYAPSVSAVVSDVALLSKPSAAELRPIQIEQEAQYPIGTQAGRETVIEEYTDADNLLRSRTETGLTGGPVVARDSSWVWPTKGPVARGFAPLKEGRHGVDIAGLPGQPVLAVKDGQVAYSGKDPSGSGNLIIVRHEDSLLTAYSHAKDLFVAERDIVRAGDQIATLGWNARQESVLRFEVRQDGNSLNPMNFLSD